MPTPEQQRQYQELEAAIMRKVYPEAVYDEQYGEWAMPNGNGGFFLKKPGLEDVLRMPDPARMRGATEIENALHCYRFLQMWQLGKPLSDQSDETKLWLHSLLLP